MWRVSCVLEISSQTERSVCRPLSVASRKENEGRGGEKKEMKNEKGYGRLRFC